MADESGAAGVAKGLTRTLTSRMWDGQGWRQPGEMLGLWLTSVIRDVPKTCAYCRHEIAVEVRRALASGPSLTEIEQAGVMPDGLP